MKLQKKYFLIFATLFVVLSLALSVTAYFLSNNILLKKYEEITAGSLAYLLDETDKELSQLSSTFNFIANNPTVHGRIVNTYEDGDTYKKLVTDNEVTDMFNAMSTFEVFDSISFLYIQGINGEEYFYKSAYPFMNKDNIFEGIDLNSEVALLTYYGMKENENPYLDTPYTLSFTKGLVDTLGAKTGVLYFELDADYFRELYENTHIDGDTNLILVDQEGKIIYHKDSYMIFRTYEKTTENYVVIDQVLKDYGWHLISEIPADQIYEENSEILRVTLIMAAVSIILGVILIIFITGRIVKPIKRLTEAVSEVSDGNYDVFVFHDGDDEIGDLTKNFNRMADQLHDNLDKEISYNKAINDAEYKALQAQINPHFMYNSLNALKWLAGIQKADNIIEVVDALWKLLRMTSSLKGQMVTLENEVEMIKAYCTIQQVRYKGKFDVEYDIDETHLGIKIPKYILQPFVENSIFHGIEPKKGTGTIKVHSTIKDSKLVLTVEDDGIGIEEERLDQILQAVHEHDSSVGLNNIGVKNINERLVLKYGESFRIHIESVVGQGTSMTFAIPIEAEEGDSNE